MSDIPTEPNIAEIVARIARRQAETEKFQAEQRKLIAESMRLDRDRSLAPWLAIAGLVGGIVAIVTLLLCATGVTP